MRTFPFFVLGSIVLACALATAEEPKPPTTQSTRELLDTKVPEVKFTEVAFADALDFIRDTTQLNIFVNWKQIEQAKIDRNAPVTLDVKDKPLEAVLKDAMASADGGKHKLALEIGEGVVTISTADDIARARAAEQKPQPLTPQAKEMLAKRVPELRFEDVGFADVIDFLRDVMKLDVSVDWKALEAAGVKRETPVSLRIRNLPLETTLNLILETAAGEKGKLAFQVDKGVISITTREALAATKPPEKK